jgi:hypothetical protein
MHQVSVLVPRFGLEGSIPLQERMSQAPSSQQFVLHLQAEDHVLEAQDALNPKALVRLRVFDRVEVAVRVEEGTSGNRSLRLDLVSPQLYELPADIKQDSNPRVDVNCSKKQRLESEELKMDDGLKRSLVEQLPGADADDSAEEPALTEEIDMVDLTNNGTTSKVPTTDMKAKTSSRVRKRITSKRVTVIALDGCDNEDSANDGDGGPSQRATQIPSRMSLSKRKRLRMCGTSSQTPQDGFPHEVTQLTESPTLESRKRKIKFKSA